MAYLMDGVPLEIKAAVDALRYNSLFTVTVGISNGQLPDYSAVYVPDPDLLFHRISFPAVFSPENVRKGTSLIQAEITANAGDGVWDLPDEEVLNKVVSGLENIGLVRRSEICYERVIRTKYGYVVRDFTYRSHLDLARAYFEGQGIELCGRVAEFEYINMDQCIERALKVAERVNQNQVPMEEECPQLQLR